MLLRMSDNLDQDTCPFRQEHCNLVLLTKLPYLVSGGFGSSVIRSTRSGSGATNLAESIDQMKKLLR